MQKCQKYLPQEQKGEQASDQQAVGQADIQPKEAQAKDGKEAEGRVAAKVQSSQEYEQAKSFVSQVWFSQY